MSVPKETLGFALERWHREILVETGNFSRIGGWWDRNGENEIDLIAADEEGKSVEFFEVKRSAKRYNPALLERKMGAFLKATGKFRGWRASCSPLGMPEP